MKKFFENKPLLFAIILIVIYVLLTSTAQSNFGYGSALTLLILLGLLGAVLAFVFSSKLSAYLGLIKPVGAKRFLYFIPLLLIASVNLWHGVAANGTVQYILFYILSMCAVGFLEELIFRGFLFKAIEKKNLNTAIIISSLTFGLGHIVNLANGAELLPTLLQILYAVSIGYLFVIIFIKSGSIVPCIICHCLLNALSVFAVQGSSLFDAVSAAVLVVVSLAYAIYLKKTIAPQKSDK